MGTSDAIAENGKIIPSLDIHISPAYDGFSHDIACIVLSEYEIKFGNRLKSSTYVWNKYVKNGASSSVAVGFINNNGVHSLVALNLPTIKYTECDVFFKKHKKVIPTWTHCGAKNKELTTICESDKGGSNLICFFFIILNKRRSKTSNN